MLFTVLISLETMFKSFEISLAISILDHFIHQKIFQFLKFVFVAVHFHDILFVYNDCGEFGGIFYEVELATMLFSLS